MTRRATLEAIEEAETVPVGLGSFCAYFLRLGTTGFGGPIALAGFMQRDLVDERRWISRQDYLDGLALAQLAPGPLAAQLAMYLGYVRAGAWPLRAAALDAVTMPASRNSHAISRSVQAVVNAMMPKMLHNSAFRPSVRRVSFWADRATMAMTAAPTP